MLRKEVTEIVEAIDEPWISKNERSLVLALIKQSAEFEGNLERKVLERDASIFILKRDLEKARAESTNAKEAVEQVRRDYTNRIVRYEAMDMEETRAKLNSANRVIELQSAQLSEASAQ